MAHTRPPLTQHTPSQAKTLLSDDYGKDLAGVETLIRRHDELERDLTAIENKLEVRTYIHVYVIIIMIIKYIHA